MKFLSTILAVAPAALAAPILEAKGTNAIPNRWIVVMKPEAEFSVTSSAVADALGGAKPEHVYNIGEFRGFSVEATDQTIATVAQLPDLAWIEPDIIMSTADLEIQGDVPWGLARISSRAPGTTEYVYDESAGEGTFAYIIDTGIQLDHPEFEGRASFGASFVPNDTAQGDPNGHGTHVAGITGSVSYGVAKKTELIAVRVLGAAGNGALSDVIAGIQWAVQDATAKGRIGKAVANMSLGALSLLTSSVSTVAAAAVSAGLFLAVAAGNANLPANWYTPAGEKSVCTVGATAFNDTRAYFSNYGDLVDVFAPGVGVVSTFNNGSTAVLSGTSMAAPHVAGLAAYLLALEGEREPIPLCARIQELATKNIVGDAKSVNSHVVYNGNAE